MKVYLEGFEKHHETGGVLRQKNTVNLFTRAVVSYTAVSYSEHFTRLNSSETNAVAFIELKA